MSLEQLTELCKERGIKMPVKPTRLKLIQALLEEDEQEEDEEELPFSTDEEDEDDEIQNAIAQALAKRKSRK